MQVKGTNFLGPDHKIMSNVFEKLNVRILLQWNITVDRKMPRNSSRTLKQKLRSSSLKILTSNLVIRRLITISEVSEGIKLIPPSSRTRGIVPLS